MNALLVHLLSSNEEAKDGARLIRNLYIHPAEPIVGGRNNGQDFDMLLFEIWQHEEDGVHDPERRHGRGC
jgi:hypothetical protein